MCRTVCVPVMIIENTVLNYSVIVPHVMDCVSMHACLAYRDLNSCVEFTCRDSLTCVIAVDSSCIVLLATTIRITLCRCHPLDTPIGCWCTTFPIDGR
jgi:hypothetical protein